MIRNKIKHHLTPMKIWAIAGLIILVVISRAGLVFSQPVAQGYTYDAGLQRGMIVSLDPDDTSRLLAATSANLEHLHGVVIDANDSPVKLTAEGRQTFVTIAGRHEVLVSDQNGQINPGDGISVSSLAGIGMKADRSQAIIIGKAVNGSEGGGEPLGRTEVDTPEGRRTVALSRVLVEVGVAANPNGRPVQNDITDFFSQVSEAIAQKPVSPWRTYVALLILIGTTGISGSILYAGVRSAIISIGRNPLSKKSIVRSLVQVVLTGFIIFISGFGAVYLLLRL